MSLMHSRAASLRWRPQASLSRQSFRSLSTLSNNSHIYIIPTGSESTPTPSQPAVLSLLKTSTANSKLAIGTTSTLPPTPSSVTENSAFLSLVNKVLKEHAVHDPDIQAQAKAFASTGGSTLGGSQLFAPQYATRTRRGSSAGAVAGGGGGAGGASGQGGMGSGGRPGWMHINDSRKPPDFGRVADPEDIFGSLEVDGDGSLVGVDGNFQASGTYRLCTNDGILGLTPYLMERLVEHLQKLEKSNI